MLPLQILRQNPELVKERLDVKNFKELQLVDDIIALDDSRKKLTFQFDDTKSKINAASNEIGGLMAKGQKAEADEKKKEQPSRRLHDQGHYMRCTRRCRDM